MLLQFLVKEVLKQQSLSNEEDGTSVFFVKQLLLPIRALCTGQSLLARTEEVVLVSFLRNATIPSVAKASSSESDKKSATSTAATATTATKEPKREWNDLSNSILEQLTMPLQDFVPTVTVSSDTNLNNINNAAADSQGTESNADVKVITIITTFYLEVSNSCLLFRSG